MRITLFLLSLLSFYAISFAQDNLPSIYYTYDNAGNRTGRIIITDENSDATSGSGQNQARRKNSNTDTSDSEPPTTLSLSNADIRIYPNPTAGLLYLKTNLNDVSTPLRYVLYGSNGETLFDGLLNSGEAEVSLDISNYARSTYYLTLFNDAEKRVWKIIKQ